MAKLIKQATGYDIGQNRFFEWLRGRGYLHKDGSQTNMPTQRAWMPDGWRSRRAPASEAVGKVASPARRITGEGQIYFINLFKENGGVMIIRCRHRIPIAGPWGSSRWKGSEGSRAISAPAALPKQGCHWLYRTACAKCVDKIEVPLEGSAREHKGPLWSNGPKGEKMMQVHQNVEDSMPAIGSAVKGKGVSMGGYFKVWRKIEDSKSWSRGARPWADDPPLLQKANWKQGYFHVGKSCQWLACSGLRWRASLTCRGIR